MGEVKNAFVKSKMNKDLDSRLMPSGEYRNAINAQVSKSEGQDVGALENVLGNINAGSIASISAGFGIPIPLIDAAIVSNEKAHKRVVDRVMHELGGSLVGKTIAILGLTFKANTDDTRQSPAIAVIERLIGRGAKVVAFDPIVSVYSLA